MLFGSLTYKGQVFFGNHAVQELKKGRWLFIMFFSLYSIGGLQAQGTQKVEIIHANSLEGVDGGGQKFRKLIGDVQMAHGGAFMFCDSAYDYVDQNFFEAYGHIRLEQGDSIRMSGEFLHYDLKDKTALIRGKVVLSDGKMTLSTSKIIYNLKNKIAFYEEQARIVDSNNVLVSDRGFYNTQTEDIVFKNNVKLTNPDNTLICDSLRYNIRTRTTWFLSPTTISGKKIQVYCEGGWYNTSTRVSEFKKNAYIKSEGQTIYGDILRYEIRRGYGRASGNVRLVDTVEKVTVTGKLAEHYKTLKTSLVTDSALMIKYMEKDTLYIHADTMRIKNQDRGDTLLFTAFYHVRAYSRELSFSTDSLSYSGVDSTIYFYRSPVIWAGENQVTASHVEVYLVNRKIDRTYLAENAFIISIRDSLRYNQVKGRSMMGYFKNNKLVKVDVFGNAEAVYYLMDDANKYIGMNKILSSYINIFLEEGKISGIHFLTTPTGNVIAPVEMDTPEARLKGFQWYGQDRPEKVSDLFNSR